MSAFYIPARDSRHRLACFALYRALLRESAKVPLPVDLASGNNAADPIKDLIRRGFRRNRSDISQRLVISALQNGYKFITLLHHAQNPASPRHTEVLTFLRANLATLSSMRAAEAARRTALPSSAPKPDTPPLLRRIPPERPSDYPVFESTGLRPRPLSEIRSGIRKVPSFDVAQMFPFLRFQKPQPAVLSRVLQQKLARHQEKYTTIVRLVDDLEEARLEEQWDLAVERQAQMEGLKLRRVRTEPKWRQALWDAITSEKAWLWAEHREVVARGRALWKIVEAEKKLAMMEAGERKEREREEKRARRLASKAEDVAGGEAAMAKEQEGLQKDVSHVPDDFLVEDKTPKKSYFRGGKESRDSFCGHGRRK